MTFSEDFMAILANLMNGMSKKPEKLWAYVEQLTLNFPGNHRGHREVKCAVH